VITTIVLTAGDDAPDYGGDLSSVAEDIDTGDAVGSSTFKSTKVRPGTMVRLLEECGSDATFFEELVEDGY
jgi:hypothetical protein